MISASGASFCTIGRIVSAPRNMVSSSPRACISRSVKTWPRAGIGAQLDLVHAQERHRPVDRHGFDGAQEITGVRRDDLLLAGHQRRLARALLRHHAVVVLARQEAQREADHPAAVAQHPLDGEVGLPRIRRAEDRGYPAAQRRSS